MGQADLAIWPQLALVIFFAVFVAVVFRVFQRSRVEEFKRAAMLPLDEEGSENV